MPQINKGGKYVFGWSPLTEDLCIKIPDEVILEYDLLKEGKLILISGSKTSGGFVVSRLDLIKQSIMKGLIVDYPDIGDYSLPEGKCLKYKGRYYCWVKINTNGNLKLPAETAKCFDVRKNDKLLSIRESNIGFVLAVKGPIVERANKYEGTIEEYLP